jgi:hypothetical protein
MKSKPQKAWLRSSPERGRRGRRDPNEAVEVEGSEAGVGIKFQ